MEARETQTCPSTGTCANANICENKETQQENVTESEELVCRNLELQDFGHNFPDILAQLTDLGDIGLERAKEIFFDLEKDENYKIFIIKKANDPKILGVATLFLEKKFIHCGGKVAHIEDVVVELEHRKKGFGTLLIQKCTDVAQSSGCYKMTLTCSAKNVVFYEKMGMANQSLTMIRYFKK